MLNILSIFIYALAFGLAITTNSFILVFLLISVFFLIFILFLLFGVNFLALSFLIVYIGAVAILFLFAVMLLGQQTVKKDTFSITLKLFLISFFTLSLALFFVRVLPFWYYNSFSEPTPLIDINSFLIKSSQSSLSNQKIEVFAKINANTNTLNSTGLDELQELNFQLQNDCFLLFNENLNFIETNLKNEMLLDIYSISSKLYEDFSTLFILSGLLLLIAMLAVVGLIVPPKNKTMKS